MATRVSEIWCVISACQITRTLLRRLDEFEVSQLLHEVGHLLCEASRLLYEVGHQIVTAIMGCGRLRHKSRPSFGKYNNPTSFNRV